MKKTDWSEIEEQYDAEEPETVKRRGRKRFDEDEDEFSRKEKKSGKRFHRKKTLKDEPWEN